MQRLRVSLALVMIGVVGVHLYGLSAAVVDWAGGRRGFAGPREVILVCVLVGWSSAAVRLAVAVTRPSQPRRGQRAVVVLGSGCGLLLLAWGFPASAYAPVTLAGSVAVAACGLSGLPLAVLAAAETGVAVTALSLAGAGELAVAASLAGLLSAGAALAMGFLWAEHRAQAALLDQARWAASKLPTVILRLDSTIRQERGGAVAQERRRVAQAVHDTVGYSLTALIAQLTSVQDQIADAATSARLQGLEGLARSLLRETREFVANMRENDEREDVDWPERWRRTCETFSDCTGVRVQAELERPETMTDAVGSAVYHIIQEGLTNAYRHGHATFVAVTMLWRPERRVLLMKISDDGRGAEAISPGSGLSGIRERAESFGGSALWKSHPDRGFDLAVDLPVPSHATAGSP